MDGQADWIELGRFLLALITAAAAAGWAILTWRAQKNRDREQERKRLAALYVYPFLMVCEELQSRLYNILKGHGLEAMAKRPGGGHAEETLYMVAQYFGWEQCLLRYTPYTQDGDVIRLIGEIRSAFAKDKVSPKGTAFWFFRPEQIDQRVGSELGRADTADAAVAPRSTPARRSGLEHTHLDALLAGEVQRRREAGITTADDRHVTIGVALERVAPAHRRAVVRLPVAVDRLRPGVNRVVIEIGHDGPSFPERVSTAHRS